MSSYAATRPDIARPVSAVFRAALSAWVKVLAEELAPHGVRANAVLPGFIDSKPVPQAIVDGIPFGRAGTVAELARTVALLASDDASFVTGQCLLVDGGMVRSLGGAATKTSSRRHECVLASSRNGSPRS